MYPADLFVPCCKGSYYLRRVSIDSGLLAVVKITGDVDETLEVQVMHFRSVWGSNKLIVILEAWTNRGRMFETVNKDSPSPCQTASPTRNVKRGEN